MTAFPDKTPASPDDNGVDQCVAENLLRLRTTRGFSTTRLAAELKELGQPIPPTGITRVEKGERRVTAGEVVALAAALRVSPLTLLLPSPKSARTEYALPGLGLVTARHLWDWARGREPLTLVDDDPAGEVRRFPLDSLPPWARPDQEAARSPAELSVKATDEQWSDLVRAGFSEFDEPGPLVNVGGGPIEDPHLAAHLRELANKPGTTPERRAELLKLADERQSAYEQEQRDLAED